jgi:hypothetical protein
MYQYVVGARKQDDMREHTRHEHNQQTLIPLRGSLNYSTGEENTTEHDMAISRVTHVPVQRGDGDGVRVQAGRVVAEPAVHYIPNLQIQHNW